MLSEMDQHPDHTLSMSLKEDISRTELLSVESDVDSFSLPTTKHGQDSAEGQWPHKPVMVKGWPQSFKTLREIRWKKAASLAIDTCIALIPLVFIGKSYIASSAHKRSSMAVHLLTDAVLSVVSISLSGSPISTNGDTVKAATTLVPCTFSTITFSD